MKRVVIIKIETPDNYPADRMLVNDVIGILIHHIKFLAQKRVPANGEQIFNHGIKLSWEHCIQKNGKKYEKF